MPPSVWKAAIVLVAAFAVPYCFYSVVAIWAARSRRHWFLRALAAVTALLLLLPIRAYEVYVFFLLFVGVILAVSAVASELGNARTNDQADHSVTRVRHPLRFRLSDLFLLVLLAAILTAATVYVFRKPMLFNWLGMLLTSVSSALAAVATFWFVFGKGNLVWRVLLWFVITPAAPLCWRTEDWLGVEEHLYLQWDKGWLFLACYLSLFVWYMLWFGSFSAVNWPASPTSKPAGNWSRLVARITLVCLTVVCAILPSGWMYLQLARPLPDRISVTANPNGFHDLIRAGTQLDPNTIPDVSTASTETLRTFVGKHSAVLEQARAALSKPCQVPLDYRVNGFRMDYVTQLRSLAHLFQAQAVLAHRESRPEEAARAGFDCVRLAHKGSRGGLQVDFLVAVAIEGMIASQISECRKELDADICRELISELERIDRDREPVVDFSQRDRDWTRIVVGWRHDFWQAVYKLAGFHDGLDLYESFQHRNEATMRLLIADLALQAYRLEQGQYPERLDSLVPDLMRSVPVDPFDGQPLRYRLEEGNEYVLYCVGLDGVDHGGQRVSEQKIMRGEGDYFLDAMAEESEE